MKTLLLDPFLAVLPADKGWTILCRPGPLAELLVQMAGPAAITMDGFAANGHGPRYGTMRGEPIVAIPLTGELDRALMRLVDALITLRYETGRVQLRLALEPGEEMP